MLPLHLQNEVIHPDGQIRAGFGDDHQRRAAFVDAASKALKAASKSGIPRVFVRMAFQVGGTDLPDNCELYRFVKQNEIMREGSWGAEFVDCLAPDRPSDVTVSHNRVNAFYATQLEQMLSDYGCEQLVLFGVATHSWSSIPRAMRLMLVLKSLLSLTLVVLFQGRGTRLACLRLET